MTLLKEIIEVISHKWAWHQTSSLKEKSVSKCFSPPQQLVYVLSLALFIKDCPLRWAMNPDHLVNVIPGPSGGGELRVKVPPGTDISMVLLYCYSTCKQPLNINIYHT